MKFGVALMCGVLAALLTPGSTECNECIQTQPECAYELRNGHFYAASYASYCLYECMSRMNKVQVYGLLCNLNCQFCPMDCAKEPLSRKCGSDGQKYANKCAARLNGVSYTDCPLPGQKTIE